MRPMRRLLLSALALFCLGILVLGIILTEGHLQIRGISPALPSEAALRTAIASGQGPRRVYSINTASQAVTPSQSMTFPAFVLEWPGGRRFIIDAGMEPEAAVEFGKPIEWLTGADPVRPHGSVGEQMGAESQTVAGAGFTHLHSDHTGGFRSLCPLRDGQLAIFQVPLQADEQNHTTDPGLTLLLDADCVRFERLAGGPIYPIPGFPGLIAVAAGGHTPGSTVFVAQVNDRLWIFSGDITNSRSELELDRAKSFLYSLLIVPEDPQRLKILRAWLRELDRAPDATVVVSHDLEALNPQGEDPAIPGWR
jgi:glyoxylase-like metal-dependent hydrolase (beta-lactamase superfamily II)